MLPGEVIAGEVAVARRTVCQVSYAQQAESILNNWDKCQCFWLQGLKISEKHGWSQYICVAGNSKLSEVYNSLPVNKVTCQ